MHSITRERIDGDDGEVFMSSRRPHRCNRANHELAVGNIFILEILRDERVGISSLVSHDIELRKLMRVRMGCGLMFVEWVSAGFYSRSRRTTRRRRAMQSPRGGVESLVEHIIVIKGVLFRSG